MIRSGQITPFSLPVVFHLCDPKLLQIHLNQVEKSGKRLICLTENIKQLSECGSVNRSKTIVSTKSKLVGYEEVNEQTFLVTGITVEVSL